MTNRLYIGNLPYSVNDSALQELFSQVGEVVSAKVVIDRDSGRSKGFGFVEFANSDDAGKAVETLDGHEIDGRRIKVAEAHPQDSQGGGGGGRGGPRRFGGGGGGGGGGYRGGGGGGGRNGGGRGGPGGGGGRGNFRPR